MDNGIVRGLLFIPFVFGFTVDIVDGAEEGTTTDDDGNDGNSLE